MAENDIPYKDIYDAIERGQYNEIKGLLRQYVPKANRRIKALLEMEEETGAIAQGLRYRRKVSIDRETPVKFTAKGKDVNKLKAELSEVRDFLSAKTSTVRGEKNTRKLRREALERITGGTTKNISDAELSAMWEAVHKAAEQEGLKLGGHAKGTLENLTSGQLIKEVFSMMFGEVKHGTTVELSADEIADIVDTVRRTANKEYEDIQDRLKQIEDEAMGDSDDNDMGGDNLYR